MPLVTRSSGNADVFIGTTTPTASQSGSLWQDTNTNLATLKEWNGSAWTRKMLFSNSAVVSHSTKIGDYTTPSAINTLLFSDDFTSYANQAAADAVWVSNDTAKNRVNVTNDYLGIDIVLDSSNDNIIRDVGVGEISDTSFKVRFNITFSALTQSTNNIFYIGLSTTNQASAANAAQDFIGMRFRNTSGTTEYGTLEADGVGLNTKSPDNVQSITWATSTTYYFEINRIDSTNYEVKRYSNSTYTTVLETVAGSCAATVAGLRYFKLLTENGVTEAGQWTGYIDDVVVMSSGSTGANAIDNNTATKWTSSSTDNPFIYVDMGSALNFCEVAFYHDKTNTTATTITIDVSSDAVSWTNVRTFLNASTTDSAYNYYRFNIKTARYLRFRSSNTASVLSIYEIKVMTKTDAQIFSDLGIVEISATDTSLDGDGV